MLLLALFLSTATMCFGIEDPMADPPKVDSAMLLDPPKVDSAMLLDPVKVDPANLLDPLKVDQAMLLDPMLEPTPEDIDQAMINVIVMQPVKVDPEKVMKNDLCPLNTPYHGECDKDDDCAKGFMCIDYEMDKDEDKTMKKVCCLANADLAANWKCPATSISLMNKFCKEDGECGDKGTCNKEFLMPEDMIAEMEAEMGEREETLGLCCTEQDVYPEVMDHCPKGYQPADRDPCGLSLEQCDIGSSCMTGPEGMFGRCCRDADTEIKTEDSNYYFHRGYYPRYRGYGYGRGYYGRGYGYGRGYYGGRGYGYGRGFYGRGYGYRGGYGRGIGYRGGFGRYGGRGFGGRGFGGRGFGGRGFGGRGRFRG